MIDGKVSSCFAARVRVSPVCAIDKGNGRVRPIEPGGVWARLASHVALALVPKTFLSAMEELQGGVGGDVEAQAAAMRSVVAPSECVAFLDAANAFNSVSRAWLLRELYAQRPPRRLAPPASQLSGPLRSGGAGGGDPFVLRRPAGHGPRCARLPHRHWCWSGVVAPSTTCALHYSQILAAGTAHILSDASLRVDDAFGVYLRQRLLLRVTPAGATCACGEDASNAHPLRMLTPAGPRAARPADNLAPPVAAIMHGRYCVRT